MGRLKCFKMYLVAAGLVVISVTTSPASVRGDVDNDGVVRLADALLVMRSIVGTQILTPEQATVCHVSGGTIFPPPILPQTDCDISDAVMILYMAYGLM